MSSIFSLFLRTFSYTQIEQIYNQYFDRYQLNVWDVGGQKSLRSYWRNYFECTDGLIWVVDSADKRRLQDCKDELQMLLQEEVPTYINVSPASLCRL